MDIWIHSLCYATNVFYFLGDMFSSDREANFGSVAQVPKVCMRYNFRAIMFPGLGQNCVLVSNVLPEQEQSNYRRLKFFVMKYS